MEIWGIFAFLDAMLKGFFECAKKKAVEKNSIYEVLAFFSLISFLLVTFTSENIFDVGLLYIIIILIKALIIVLAWILSLYALRKISVGLYSVINLSRIVFIIIMSVVFLGEKITITAFIGLIIVLLGLILVNKTSNKKENREISLKVLVIVIISCLLNAISAMIDKKILQDITSSQLQFWFLLFLTIIYWIILLIKNRKIDFKNIKKNYWIPIIAICLTFGDKFLFMANAIPESKVSVITIIKQFSVIEAIILGRIVFKEKNIIKKLLYSILIIFGIILTLI